MDAIEKNILPVIFEYVFWLKKERKYSASISGCCQIKVKKKGFTEKMLFIKLILYQILYLIFK
ncbi:hypothetical protein BGV40_09520 [Methanosarcina sp. Ant1]|nr:hypothetical protein BGV40_09520 [Methanosarcina sp. Ant1]